MSEYQYCEFRAIDQPLTEKEIAKLRSYSTRADITSTTFTSEYSGGDFKGNEDKWMEKYFDAFLYIANWGTRSIQLRLPSSILDPKIAQQYCPGEIASVRHKDGKTIISFTHDNEEGEEEWIEGNKLLSGILPVRVGIANGDYRALYLGWLLCAQSDSLDENCIEPPVPPGLKKLSGSLKQFAKFLRIDENWLDIAAQESQVLTEVKPTQQKVSTWLAGIPAKDKDKILAALMLNDSGDAPTRLLQRYLKDQNIPNKNIKQAAKLRTVKELRAAVANLDTEDIAM